VSFFSKEITGFTAVAIFQESAIPTKATAAARLLG